MNDNWEECVNSYRIIEFLGEDSLKEKQVLRTKQNKQNKKQANNSAADSITNPISSFLNSHPIRNRIQ